MKARFILSVALLGSLALAAIASDPPPAPPHAADLPKAAPAHAEAPASDPRAAGATHGDDHGGGGNIFAGGIGNVVWTTIIFLIVVAILGSKAWPPLLKVLKEREDSIRESLETARREREASEKLLKQYQHQLDEAGKKATAIVDEGRRDAEEVRRRIQEEARKEADETLARARREIQLATDAAIKELYDQTAALAIQAASNVVRRQLSAEDHDRLVGEALEQIRAGGKARMN
ncbi:ATP synthase subunit b [Phycisphaerae bacterium RAS1]|nr:ATP synthase subunit b [Phycisphaerae bacterium RAS1]